MTDVIVKYIIYLESTFIYEFKLKEGKRMFKLRKIIYSYIICFSLIIIAMGINNVSAQEVTPYAIEKYNREVTIGLGIHGHIDVTLVLSHNMTTKKTHITEVKKDLHFNPEYPFLTFKKVTTNPGIGTTFIGSNQVKVTVTYANEIPFNSETITKYGYVTL